MTSVDRRLTFAGKVRTKDRERSTHSFSSGSSAMASASTSTQPFIGFPVTSNADTPFSFTAFAVSSGGTRAMSESFHTPATRLPRSIQATPPNIFFSTAFGRRSRMRSAKPWS